LAVTSISLVVAFYLTFLLGGFDSVVRGRAADIAQLENEEWVNDWFGVRLLQYPTDLMTYQQLVQEIRPDIVIETGTYSGGLTLYLSHLLEQLHPEGKVISVDIDTKPARDNFAGLAVPGKASLLERIQLIEASSTDPTTIATISEQVGSTTRVLIVLDSLHSRENVLRELELYGPFVSNGSYVIVNDTHLGRWYPESGDENITYGGAALAVADFLAKTDDFEVDRSRDRFLISCAPGGFLKRVR